MRFDKRLLRPPPISTEKAWFFAFLCPVVTTTLQYLLVPRMRVAPFLLSYVALTLVSWLGGIGPGVMATLVAGSLVNHFVIEPVDTFKLSGIAFHATVLFSLTGVAIAVLVGSLQSLFHEADLTASSLREGESRMRQLAEERQAALDSLQQANGRLEETDERRSRFLALLSHELRNPLAPIRNSVYVLERVGPGTGPIARARETIDRQARHLTRLVDDLLDLGRIEHGKMQLHVALFDLGALVRRVAEDHRELFAGAGVKLEVTVPEEPIEIAADSARVVQMIGNLLGNAAKFTPPGGHAEIALRREAASAEIVVRDTGAGMSREVLSTIFEPFVQADQTLARSRGGLGLGLALTRVLASLHQGTIEAHSEGPGRGSQFVVRLPVSIALPERAAEPERRHPHPPAALARRILVIEDNPDAAESLKAALELDGHFVEVALSGNEGLEKARAFWPDVILCDLGLPGLDGYEVARAIKAGGAASAPGCLVALSGYGQPEDIERARQAGFDRHMLKPPNMADLNRLLAVTRPCRGKAADLAPAALEGEPS